MGQAHADETKQQQQQQRKENNDASNPNQIHSSDKHKRLKD
jgi:hypothetical protein